MSDPKAKDSWPFALAMRDFFDNVQKTAGEFMAELKLLSDEEKAWFTKELERVGYNMK